ncbi:DUF4336 domain-containing protein [Thetidibacter halocola]|uniref:DUF4336 domain-containing protein n=1 Tax=Thetidibacter halocola TaxID=2827239 RepID=A0A8J7WJQ9_9RHOB|nr:DUF4336 domain-containing protein [Thetidibacter halocola]MBS0126249.1 DUF4336 domain-containing protein [Thetidibacter halocola]
MLEPFGSGLWLAEGGTISVAGFGYPTRMAVMRLDSGALLLWSPVSRDGLIETVRALGPVAHILAPNRLHHLALAEWAAAFPNALLHAAPGLRVKRSDLRFGSDLGQAPHPDWAGQIDQVVLRGNAVAEEVVFLHRASGTVLVTDLLQQFPPGFHHGWRAVVARLDRMVGPKPRMPRKFRLAFGSGKAARGAARTLLDWPAERLVVAHGAPVTAGAKTLLQAEFGWLAGKAG